jgi:hypothetical protein
VAAGVPPAGAPLEAEGDGFAAGTDAGEVAGGADAATPLAVGAPPAGAGAAGAAADAGGAVLAGSGDDEQPAAKSAAARLAAKAEAVAYRRVCFTPTL